MPSLVSNLNVPAETLAALLHRVFGHREFRPHQEQVCEAAAAGRDVLLVMPTGAGKSLCYQLPALARGGTALVISPLIALMDDQATKLGALGLRVARVHSGMDREASRQACRDYLAGELDFLFIAPERMRVPGFPQMLAKRKPALVAIDEAHCISAWGHDFRPDYRTLGQYLPALRPAPIIALTATATPTVQKDIAVQLDLQQPKVFITGFRRENLAVQAVELSKPQRGEFTAELLKDKAARPAIVYAASRKSAEELAETLSRKFSCKAYHAGLEPSVRERVQRDFLGGKLDVVVATVAFGMGVDKADVRTVVHIALPGSVEAFYQEIGRAGRDGLPSRTVLLYSFADRKTQEFFLEKNYPPVSDLDRVAHALGEEFVEVDSLQRRLKMDRETLDRSLEKLMAVNVAVMDMNGDVRGTGETQWKSGYDAQVAARRAQIDRMVAFAEGHQCRMMALVEHFGDTTDRRGPCGRCDVCDPSAAGGGEDGHAPDARECEKLRAILRAIQGRGQSVGKLFTDLKLTKDRGEFDGLLEGLARAGLLTIANDTFRTPDGKDVTYRKATITHEGHDPDDATLATVWIRGGDGTAGSGKTTAKKARKAVAIAESAAMGPEAEKLFERLRAWRTEQARPTKTPAFMILTDATLRAIAVEAPQNLAALHRISGIGTGKIDRYGAAVLAVCRGDAPVTADDGVGVGSVRKAAPVVAKVAAERSIPFPVTPAAAAMPVAVRSGSAKVGTSVSAVQMKKVAAPMVAKVLELSAEQAKVEEKLKVWRLEEAKKAGLPSFFIFSDTVLRSIVVAKPGTMDELRGVRGVGPEKVDRYGAAVIEIVRG
jgi:ATP-dependent DNA helicase RecQ